MNLTWLNEYVVLAETQSYSEAAKKLFLSQPCLSKHIAQMEAELDICLLERRKSRGSTVCLTNAGKVLYERAKLILALYEDTTIILQYASGRAQVERYA